MNPNSLRLIFQGVLTITLFSLWAVFALLIVNKYFYKDLPGYTIGRICIWEFIAIIIAGFISQLMINNWGSLKKEMIGNRYKLTMNPKYGIYFLLYLLIVIVVGIWQFWIFSQKF